MSDTHADLAEQAEGVEDGQPSPASAHEPAAADQSSDGTATQDNPGQHTTTTDPAPEPDDHPTEADDLDAAMRAEFVADPEPDPEPEQDATPAPAEAQQDPPKEQPQGADHQPPTKEQADVRKPDDPTEEELRGYHPQARGRIKNLLSRSKAAEAAAQRATGAIEALERHAMDAGFTTAQDLMESVSIFGRARRGDQQARAAVVQALGIQAAQQPQALTDDDQEFFAEVESVGIDTSKMRARFLPATAAAQPGPATAPAQPAQATSAQPPRQQQQPDEQQAGRQVLDRAIQEIRQKHGANAPALMERIIKGVEVKEREARALTGQGIPAHKWGDVLNQVRAQVLAETSRPRGTPPPLRPQTSAGGRTSTNPADDLDAQFRRDYVTG